MPKHLLYLFCCLFGTGVCIAQDYSYVHYEPRDGLGGSTVYDMCQDKEGFMWFATENGISRYDGTNFRNFTTNDSLPDNEVLKLFCDSKGRVWISTFSKYICYYFDGRIYTKDNDPTLALFNFKSNIVTIAEDAEGNVAFCDLSAQIWVLTARQEIKILNVFHELEPEPLKFIAVFTALSQGRNQLIIAVNNRNYYYVDNKLVNFYSASQWENAADKKIVPIYRDPKTHGSRYLVLDFEPINCLFSESTLMFVTSPDGCFTVDTVHNKLDRHFLPGKKVSNALEDSEGNTWFSTLGYGVYKMPSKNFKSLTFNSEVNPEAYSIARTGTAISIGSGFSTLFSLKAGKLEKHDFSSLLRYAETKTSTNRLMSIKPLKDNSILLGFDSYLIRWINGKRLINVIPAIKSTSEADSGFALVGTGRGAYLLSTEKLEIIDTIWNSRATKVFYHDNEFYIGTLDGLYQVHRNKSAVFLGDLHPSLQRRITDIIASRDGTLWVATHDRGLIAIKDNKIVTVISTKNELSSDNCKALFIHGDALWVGTNKGLNKIDLSNLSAPFTKYSVSDGLMSDNVNAIYAEDSMVYVCTSLGVSYFNEKEISKNSKCILKILRIRVSGADLPVSKPKELGYKENNIRFDFVGISLKSDGDIRYRYKLEGLDDKWNDTRQNSISYPVLPSGSYTFHLVAQNKFGVRSKVYQTSFTIATPWYRSIWFWIICGLGLTAAMWFLISLRFKIISRNKEEKLNYRQRIADLEQLALRAQMNPHFIFNCLNSIQNFIINDDLKTTNRYMNSFARLLRQTLDHSAKRVISLAEEISYITTYLELEKMRFGEKFIYTIRVDEKIPVDFTFIPNMILQPFIENSIRHGILHKAGEQGIIEINFEQTDTTLTCTVNDNGIGRKQSLANKTDQHIEYHSQGMQLTFKRLELLSSNTKEKITTDISDFQEDNAVYPGTSVKIIFPLTIIDKLNQQR